MLLEYRFLLKRSILLGGLLLLTSYNLTRYFSGEWQFKVAEGALDTAWVIVPAICQNGPELLGYAGDTNLYGLVGLDGAFEVLASFFVPGISLKWIIWGNLKDNQFDWGDLTKTDLEGYYKPWNSTFFYAVKLKGRRIGPVPRDVNCPPGFRKE